MTSRLSIVVTWNLQELLKTLNTMSVFNGLKKIHLEENVKDFLRNSLFRWTERSPYSYGFFHSFPLRDFFRDFCYSNFFIAMWWLLFPLFYHFHLDSHVSFHWMMIMFLTRVHSIFKYKRKICLLGTTEIWWVSSCRWEIGLNWL